MKHFFSLIRFLLSPVRLSVMGWDDLLYGLALYAGKAAIQQGMEGDQSRPGDQPKMATMDLNALLANAQESQRKQDEATMTTNKLHFNKY